MKDKGEKNNTYQPQGLTYAEVEDRKARGLINGDQNVKTKSVGEILRTNAFTFFNFLFIGLAILLAFFVEKGLKGLANFGFLGVVILNFIIGTFQELKAKRTIDKLSLLSAPRVTVIREGLEQEISLKDIVMDDIIVLHAGNQICADSIIDNGTVEVNESLITGEPDAVVKNVGDEVLSGSFVLSGRATTRVIRVGKDNYATKISSGAKYIKPTSSVILKSVRRFIKGMAIMILPLGLALFSVKYFVHGNGLDETVLTVSGTILGMIPSGLMLLTTGVFAIGLVRLASYNALAQDLYCTETLARVDMLCLDKTGTITEGSMMVEELLPVGIELDDMKNILKNMMFDINDDNPTSNAIKDHLTGIMVTDEAISSVPFSSARKWSAAVYKDFSYVLGAAEFVLKKIPKRIQTKIDKYSDDGNRVLVLARSTTAIEKNQLPTKLEFIGYVLIADKIRQEAHATLKYFTEQGVALKIISGDNPITVKSIAQRAGLEDYENYIDATTLTDEQSVYDAAKKYSIFGRVTPDQKLMIIKALKAEGHTVTMTGDGVNDVLALKESDCSIAMASGSDAAKNVSQVVLLDNNFASLPKIVAEGRRSINNLERSSSLFLVKTGYNFLFALVFMIIQADLPFAPKHLTLLGILTIGVPSYILALEPNKDIIKGQFFRKVLNNALPGTLTVVISIVVIVVFSPLLPISSEQVSTMSLIVTATVAFTYLIKLCLPFNALRLSMVIILISLFVGAFFAEFDTLNVPELFGISTKITLDMLKIMLPVALLSIPLFIGMFYLIKELSKWKIDIKIYRQ